MFDRRYARSTNDDAAATAEGTSSANGGADDGTEASSQDDTPDEVKANPWARKSHEVIEGGFVLPYYIVLLSFLGASIALTRRIPELQKRSEPGYEGTTDQPRLDFKTVREAVVFQIMQLVTAPFIAMVAFYAIAPSSAGSGIAVGFISGFSSELVLLQIRGMVEGLFPRSVSRTAETTASTGDVVGRVTFYDVGAEGKPAIQKPAANVTVRISGDASSNGKDYTDTTDSNGDFAMAGVLAGSRVISATGGADAKGRPLSAKRLIVVSPGAEVKQNLIVMPPTSESGSAASPPLPPPPATTSP